MLAERMTLNQALTVALDIAEGRRKFGAQFSPPYRNYEIVEACQVLGEAFKDTVPKDELTLSNRRYAALNAQHERLKKRCGKDGTTEISE